MPEPDLLIRNALLLDGTGRPGAIGDLAVSGETIAALGASLSLPAERVVDASGLALCPGLVDIHSHADLALLQRRTHEVKLRQGVTLEVFTNCGLGFAPVTDQSLPLQRDYLSGLFGSHDRVSWAWRSVAEYLGELRQGLGVNAAYLVPHGALRSAVMGMENRPAARDEVHAMERLLEQSLEEGALGLSSGLWYAPMCYADTEETAALARTTARRGGVWAVHLRDYGDHILEALEEALRIAERSGVALQVSHLHTAGPANRGLSSLLLERIDRARAAGQDVTMDSYPYLAGSTLLQALLPPWANEGGPSALRERLADPRARARMERELGSSETDWSRLTFCGAWTEAARALEGLSLAAIATAAGRSAPACLLDLLESEDLRACYIEHSGHEEDVRAILAHPAQMVGSDGLHLTGHSHPRLHGTFARVLGRYVRELGLLTLEEAVRKMTSLPCERLGLRGRGRLEPGHAADLVLFDPRTVRDAATYEDPGRPPEGIHAVWVNGVQAVADETPQGTLTGRVLTP